MPSTYSARSERYAWIETKARQYARSGNYLNYKAIEAVLIEKGYPEARKLFANLWTQHEVNRTCLLARDRNKGPEEFLRLAHVVSN